MGHFYSELRRRRVFATTSIYVVVAWLTIQVADVLFPGWNIAEENIRFLVYAVVACFPVAFIIGWKYDITVRGIKRTPPASSRPEDAGLALNKFDHVLLSGLMLLAISIVLGFGWRIDAGRTLEPDFVLPNSVAILPFANLSEESDNEYFSTGLWEEVINVMGQIEGFRVTPSTSAGYFRNRELNLAEIKQKLKVANVIIGSVQKVANRVRITLSLSDTDEGENLWSQSYDRDLQDIFAIQSDIAHAVAEVMKVRILGMEEQRLEKPPTSNIEAYDLLMLAKQNDDFLRAIELIDQAIELDPAYMEAHLTRALIVLGNFINPGGGGIEAAFEQCRLSLETTRELMPDAAETSYLYNWVNGICLRRTIWAGHGNADMEREMEAAFKKAVALNPSVSTPHISYSIYLRWENRIREAEDQIRQALELDRLYSAAMYQLARVLSIQGKDEEAIEWNERIIEYFDTGYGNLAIRYADLGRYDTAIETLVQAPNLNERIWGMGITHQALLQQCLMAVRDHEIYLKFATPSSEEISLERAWELASQTKYDEAYEVAVAAVDASGATAWYVLNEPAELALLAGRFDDAVAMYEKALPSLADPLRPDVNKSNETMALELGYALQMSGETARATVLFGRILDISEGRRRVGQENKGIMDVFIYASIGETDKALAAMREAIDAGWRELYGHKLGIPSPMLEPLIGIPEYDAMVAEINADLAQQLQHIKTMDPGSSPG